MKKNKPHKIKQANCKKSSFEKTTSKNGKHNRHVTSSDDSDVSDAACSCGGYWDDLLPWWLPWAVAMITMLVRVKYVTSRENWWILHPDEVYQSVEVAFSEVYGYGFRPYEYLPPPSNVTSSRNQQILQSGMYCLRSFMYPDIFTAVLYLAKALGLDYNPYMICKIFNVMVTSLLPVSVHVFTYHVFRCRLLALLACACSALQLHLAVFGTHTLVNSFTSPFVFLAITLCLSKNESKSLNQVKTKTTVFVNDEDNSVDDNRESGDAHNVKEMTTKTDDRNGNCSNRLNGYQSSKLNGQLSDSIRKPSDSGILTNDNGTRNRLNGQPSNHSIDNITMSTNGNISGKQLNGHGPNNTTNGDTVLLTAAHTGQGIKMSTKSESSDSNNNSFKSEIELDESCQETDVDQHNDNGTRPRATRLPSVQQYIVRILGFLSKITKMQFSGQVAHLFRMDNFFGGLLLGLICYVRVDTILIASVLYTALLLVNGSSLQSKLAMTSNVTSGGVLALVIGVVYDMVRYHGFVISPLQWFKFNILSGKAQVLFASSGETSYWSEIVLNPFNAMLLSATIACVFMGSSRSSSTSNSPQPYCFPKDKLRQFCAIFICFCVTIIVYSCIGHAQLRFIHNAFVLLAILTAVSVHTIYSFLLQFCKSTVLCNLVLISVPLLNLIQTYSQFPSVNSPTSEIPKWTHGIASTSRDISVCLDWLSHQRDVNGVFIDADLYDIAGFSIIQHDVPVVVKNLNEFQIYGRNKTNSRARNGIRVINDVSDMFHKSNEMYMSKLLLQDNTFNYIVSKHFSSAGKAQSVFSFQPVHTCGDFKVYNRRLTEHQVKEMQQLTGDLPVGNNATILEYEANWLITKALYDKAIERIEGAFRAGGTRVRLYQQLMACYFRTGRQDMLAQTERQCIARHGRAECSKVHDKIVIHEEYKKYEVNRP